MNKREREQYHFELGRFERYAKDSRLSRQIMADFDSLRRIGKAINLHNERECSVEGYDVDAGERRIETKLKRAAAILRNGYNGLALATQGDPRGCGLTVYVDDGQPYEWGRQSVVMSE